MQSLHLERHYESIIKSKRNNSCPSTPLLASLASSADLECECLYLKNFPQLSGAPSRNLRDIYNHLHRHDDSECDYKKLNASRIIQMLKVVMSSLDISETCLKAAQCIYTLTSAKRVLEYDLQVKGNLESLKKGGLYFPGGSRGTISEFMAKKIAESGLNYQDLKKTYRTRRRKGLEELLKAPKDGEHQPRVTRDQQVIDKIVSHFEQRIHHTS